MTSRSMMRRAALAGTLLAALAAPVPATATDTASTSTPSSAVVLPEPPPAPTAQRELAELPVAAPRPMTGYSREKFPHWIAQSGRCDTREVVLERDGTDVVRDDQCRAVSGKWQSAYDGRELTAASQVDIDHMVPLANAWRSGADTWTTDKRKAFANDLTNPQLIAVSAASNRSKGDQSPDQWAPPLRSYWCTYSRAWTHIKTLYALTVTDAEKTRLAEMLNTCAP
ncbi:HNH endonuclease family protein [Streptomyces sp. CA-111067]|uniref:HNH endonuclease family protein n=1 Tax=Streptomyces sp. CA-111067 TaxID=3240046 RepID=UPI003D97CB13